MSKLNVDQKSINELLTAKNANFLIPDYQRPYAWGEEECQTLWDDIFTFAFPDNDMDAFNQNDEYFLGSIVTYRNCKNQSEVIDGQQRLTTMMLLLRAFYDKFGAMQDNASQKMRENISACIWMTNEFNVADRKKLKIDSEVATDDEKEEFLTILHAGLPDNARSRYAKNYRFFEDKIKKFIAEYASYLPYLPARILNNCILLPIEADSQDTALRIFSTLNDRGLPLADADIFKAQFYKFYEKQGKKTAFIEIWKELSSGTEEIFHPINGTPMDELFTKYMYFIRASEGNKSTTTEALRKFYETDKYRRLLKDRTISDLKELLSFWKSVAQQDDDRFSSDVLKRLFILKFAPNGMWEYFTSVYFLSYRDTDGNLDDAEFEKFLSKITAFIFAYALTNPGVNALRTPIYSEMLKVYKKQPCVFAEFKFDEEHFRAALENYKFTNNRSVTRSMLTWYAFKSPEQKLPAPGRESFNIEHIYAKGRYKKENILTDQNILEKLGNKILLERSINIRASDYKFKDKKRYYCGYTDANKKIYHGSDIAEYGILVNMEDFTEHDIRERDKQIHNEFIKYLKDEGLLKG
ncbi:MULTISPECIES: DUF262 domain-containing protein [unclassified Desulfovibrio]|uniref:DUF262 domain-containing protein n=1 Tax=unclassified Desulfovibrio TaxID=2593640 RepID=UPI000F5E7BBF|nr:MULTISPECIES: DUF262 domain-containing protein [unclassified Desulfovibrio]RRD70733.1 DUF262 domain-containing protein [Desulfovibrio sp. OH1209_COT-279]RRD87135.1 DUF262 domain-containing protein [Desulfovibrio sp. OH1186_COT-070]